MIFKKMTMAEVDPRLPETQTDARLFAYLHETSREMGRGENTRFPAVVICPGGAYVMTSDREADPVALQFLAAGYDVFILRYAVAPDRYPAALLETAAVIAHIRDRAEEYHIDPHKIAVCGFSAGGHLAASAGILWREPVLSETLGRDSADFRPDAALLCYPVISSGEFAHRFSFESLLGPNAGEDALRAMSLEERVTPETPPVFLWHTFSDDVVPVENTLGLAAALRRVGVPFELHIYPAGHHGLSLGTRLTWKEGFDDMIAPHIASWMPLAIKWLDLQFAE